MGRLFWWILDVVIIVFKRGSSDIEGDGYVIIVVMGLLKYDLCCWFCR